MRGMHRWLWEAFAVATVAYCLYLSPKVVLEIGLLIFIGGGILLTLVGYAAAKYSMPRPASFWLQLWYPDNKRAGKKMPPMKRFLLRLIYGWKSKGG